MTAYDELVEPVAVFLEPYSELVGTLVEYVYVDGVHLFTIRSVKMCRLEVAEGLVRLPAQGLTAGSLVSVLKTDTGYLIRVHSEATSGVVDGAASSGGL